MANEVDFDALVNPLQQAQAGARFAADGRLADGAVPGVLTLRGFAEQLERLAAQARALAQAQGPLNIRIRIDTVVYAPDPRALRDLRL